MVLNIKALKGLFIPHKFSRPELDTVLCGGPGPGHWCSVMCVWSHERCILVFAFTWSFTHLSSLFRGISHLLSNVSGSRGYVEVVFHDPLVRVVLHGPRDERLPRRLNRSLKLCLHVHIQASSDCCPHCFVKAHSPSGRRHLPRHQLAQP